MRIPHLVFALLFAFAGSCNADFAWTDWTASDGAVSSGSLDGITVTHTGTLQFAQLGPGVLIGGGADANTNYWTEPNPADRPYTDNSVVDVAPPGMELLGFSQAGENKLTFSEPVTNPVFALLSVGQSNLPVTYDFDTPFTVLSDGEGFWGKGSFVLEPGDIIVGRDLHAVIQFEGTVSEINWTVTSEFWHGITVGAAPVVPIPEPSTFMTWVFFAVIGLGFAAYKKRASTT